jgi:hypothetical protein
VAALHDGGGAHGKFLLVADVAVIPARPHGFAIEGRHVIEPAAVGADRAVGPALAFEKLAGLFFVVKDWICQIAHRLNSFYAIYRRPSLLSQVHTSPVVGESVELARQKRAHLDSLVNYANAIASLSIALGHDASGFDPDGQLPEIPETNASKSGRERAIGLAQRENLTVRQLAQRLGGYGGLAFVGTPSTIADQMEEWLVSEASDGFNVMFPYLPEGLDDFVDRVVPELQRRGIFRREYEGKTLRENLGLPRPENQYFPRVR